MYIEAVGEGEEGKQVGCVALSAGSVLFSDEACWRREIERGRTIQEYIDEIV